MNHDEAAQNYLEAAISIRRAGNVAEIAQATVGALADCDRPDVTLGAVQACLQTLELSLVQRMASSPELASDLRLETRRKLTRLMSAFALTDIASEIAELAVQAVAALATTSRAIVEAAEKSRELPMAFAGLAGAMFVSIPAREFARVHNIDEVALHRLLGRVAAPIRRACEAHGVCNVGELRYSAGAQDIAASAKLDRSKDGAPVIRIRLHPAGQQPDTGAGESPPPPYPARVLRRLVG
jgi:hypothetical protein